MVSETILLRAIVKVESMLGKTRQQKPEDKKYIFYLIVRRTVVFSAENCKKIISGNLQTIFAAFQLGFVFNRVKLLHQKLTFDP